MKKSIVFVKPALETDAVFDPIRTASYLGIWYLASLLILRGYRVRYLDEAVRNNGLSKRTLFKRTIIGGVVSDEPMSLSYDEFEKQKLADFNLLSPKEFISRYSAFRQHGKIERIIVRTGNSIRETLSEIEISKPDYVGIPLIASSNYPQATELGRAIKKSFPRVKIMYGGQHLSTDYEDFVTENPWVDHVVIGDAMEVIEDILEGRKTEQIIYGGSNSMKNFPLLDPKIIQENDYPNEPTYAYTSSGRKTADFMFSKGCFRNCEFCVAGSQNKRITELDEIMIDRQLALFRSHGIQELIIQDDAFIHSGIDHMNKILSSMKKYGLYWQNNGGLDFQLLTKEITDLFIAYNKEGEGRITALYIPFNPREWNKHDSAAKTMIAKYHDNCENLKRLREEGGIYIFTSEIIGTPDQTIETMENDIEFHKELIRHNYLDAALTLSATLLPGTIWNKNNPDMIINKKDYAGYSLFTTHHRTKNIADPKIIEEYMVKRTKELNVIQKTFRWGTAFPNC
ncbi:MAG: cobalamin-dependent protein [bacterium]|nr:cobalamin-dependent protein [bacterium]